LLWRNAAGHLNRAVIIPGTVAHCDSAGKLGMTISFARHQLPPAIIQHAVWLCVRFTLSFRDVEDLLAERGPDVSYETVRRWVSKFGLLFAREFLPSPPSANVALASR
jgi:transposase-like protein